MSVAFYVIVIGAVVWLILTLLIVGILAYISNSMVYISNSNEEENADDNYHQHSTSNADNSRREPFLTICIYYV